MKVIAYYYCEAESPVDLVIEVNKLIKDGWEPVGGSAYFNERPRSRRYFQSMVKYGPSDPDPADDAEIKTNDSKPIPMKLVINHTRRQEIYDLNETGSVYLDVRNANWLKVYQIGDEVRVCFEFESPVHPKELVSDKT